MRLQIKVEVTLKTKETNQILASNTKVNLLLIKLSFRNV